MSAMNADRRVALIAGSGHAAKLAVNLGMDTARYVETESEVQRQSALRGIAMVRAELDELEAALKGETVGVLSVGRAAA